jgi:hypothetical protein
MESYLMDVLKISSYPTHLIINGQGKIIKVSDNLGEIIDVLNKEVAKK